MEALDSSLGAESRHLSRHLGKGHRRRQSLESTVAALLVAREHDGGEWCRRRQPSQVRRRYEHLLLVTGKVDHDVERSAATNPDRSPERMDERALRPDVEQRDLVREELPIQRG